MTATDGITADAIRSVDDYLRDEAAVPPPPATGMLPAVATGTIAPAAPVPGPLEWALIVLAVASFGFVAFAQALFPLWVHHPETAGLRVHLANGLYLNAVFDRLSGGFRLTSKS